MSAEAVSACFLHCVLKGLHKSPQITRVRELFQSSGVLTAENVSCLVIPDGCVGLPTLVAMEQGIPVVAVRQNRLSELPFSPGGLITVDNYLEAVGVIAAMKAGVSLQSTKRPLEYTNVEQIQTSTVTSSSQPPARKEPRIAKDGISVRSLPGELASLSRTRTFPST